MQNIQCLKGTSFSQNHLRLGDESMIQSPSSRHISDIWGLRIFWRMQLSQIWCFPSISAGNSDTKIGGGAFPQEIPCTWWSGIGLAVIDVDEMPVSLEPLIRNQMKHKQVAWFQIQYVKLSSICSLAVLKLNRFNSKVGLRLLSEFGKISGPAQNNRTSLEKHTQSVELWWYSQPLHGKPAALCHLSKLDPPFLFPGL